MVRGSWWGEVGGEEVGGSHAAYVVRTTVPTSSAIFRPRGGLTIVPVAEESAIGFWLVLDCPQQEGCALAMVVQQEGWRW